LGKVPTCQLIIEHHWGTHDSVHHYDDDHNHNADGGDDNDGDFLRCCLGALC
jgi:hypothetical protein